jgi:lysophospholipase L1-like esterase
LRALNTIARQDQNRVIKSEKASKLSIPKGGFMNKTALAWLEKIRSFAKFVSKKRCCLTQRRPATLMLWFFIATNAVMLPGHTAAAVLPDWEVQNWIGTWGTAPAGPTHPDQTQYFGNQTLRLVVRTSVGGSHVRIRLSNEFGNAPLVIGAAHIGVRQAGAAVSAATDRKLTFSGSSGISIPPNAAIVSDPVELKTAALSDLAISLYLPFSTPATTMHDGAFQTGYVSGTGDYSAMPVMPVERTILSWPFLTGVDVIGSNMGASIVMVGDSLTDGFYSTVDANRRWPDLLAARLQAAKLTLNPFGLTISRLLPNLMGNTSMLGVVNKGIGGNRLLQDMDEFPLYGKNLLARFSRDVTSQAGVQYLVILIGINDIGFPGTGATPISEAVSPDKMIAGYRQVIELAHEQGIAVFAGTITPLEGVPANYYTPEKELVRQAVNQWIRTGNEFDGIVDFDAALRDPTRTTRLLPAYDSGDHLHPNDAGMQAMANAVPLQLFRDNGFAKLRSLIGR